MKRAFHFSVGFKALAVLAAVGVLAIDGAAWAGRPAADFPLLVRLNGQPRFIGRSMPQADGGTIGGPVDAGLGQVVKTQCYASACVCPGTSCTCGIGQATTGELLTANAVHFMVLIDSESVVSTAAATGSLLPDGGAGAWCDHWRME